MTTVTFPQESSSFGDSFWTETTLENSQQAEFDFENKPRLEDHFGPVGYGFFRFFAIAMGTIPLSYLMGSQVYDWSIYGAKGGDPRWQPGFWGWENRALSGSERMTRVWGVAGVTIGTSLVVAVIDTLLYHLLYSPQARVKKGQKR